MSISFDDIANCVVDVQDYILHRTKRVAGPLDDECWLWTNCNNNYGYGHAVWKRRHVGAHRLSYVAFIGAIPSGLDLDHLCRNRGCCNPKHVEPVTRRVNLLRGETIPAMHAAKTECPYGHSLANARVYKGQRHCRECMTTKPKPITILLPVSSRRLQSRPMLSKAR